MSTFVTKEGDDGIDLVAILSDEFGVVNLTGYTVTFTMGIAGSPNKIEDAACTVTDALNGEVTYQWQPTDTDTPGTYQGEFKAVSGSGKIIRFPRDKYRKYLTICVVSHKF